MIGSRTEFQLPIGFRYCAECDQVKHEKEFLRGRLCVACSRKTDKGNRAKQRRRFKGTHDMVVK